jgi:hypothetical protein
MGRKKAEVHVTNSLPFVQVDDVIVIPELPPEEPVWLGGGDLGGNAPGEGDLEPIFNEDGVLIGWGDANPLDGGAPIIIEYAGVGVPPGPVVEVIGSWPGENTP